MARAKRTARAEARRRYRAQLAESGAGETEEAPAATQQARATAAPPPARPSITYAFRASFRQANFREDLAYLPTLVLRTKAVWLPTVLSVASAVTLVAGGINTVTVLFFQYFAYTLPVGALFLAGFLAPRASWLAGIIVGAASTVVLAATIASGVLGTELGADVGMGILLNSLLTSTIGGALVASASAWYKRFLNLANPSRGARGAPARGRQAPRRR